MFAKIIILALAIIALGAIAESSTPVRKCPGNYPLPLSVQLEDCEEVPCLVTRGTTLSMDVHFVSLKEETNHLEAVVRATVLGIVVPYPLSAESADVCKNLLYGAYCPLYATEDVTYHIDFPLDSSTPEVTAKNEVRLVDKDKDIIACFIVDLKVKKPRNKIADQLE